MVDKIVKFNNDPIYYMLAKVEKWTPLNMKSGHME
jgi:hypothetical protein